MLYCTTTQAPFKGIAIRRADTDEELYIVPRRDLVEKGPVYLDRLLLLLLSVERADMEDSLEAN